MDTWVTFISKDSENSSHFKLSWKCFGNLLAWMRLSFSISHWLTMSTYQEEQKRWLCCFLGLVYACIISATLIHGFFARTFEVACLLCQKKEDNEICTFTSVELSKGQHEGMHWEWTSKGGRGGPSDPLRCGKSLSPQETSLGIVTWGWRTYKLKECAGINQHFQYW